MATRKLDPSAPAFVPSFAVPSFAVPPRASETITASNALGQSYQVTRDCLTHHVGESLRAFLEDVVNLAPHVINYFDPECGRPTFSLGANSESITSMFRPIASESSYPQERYPAMKFYQDSRYEPVGAERATLIQRYLDDLSTRRPALILIMSTISGKNIIQAFKDGVLRAPAGLLLISPKSTLSVRDPEGNIIGTAGFNVMWDKGHEIRR